MDNEVVAALDIGTTKICVIVGEVDSLGSVRLLGVGQGTSEGLRKGVVVDIETAAKNIREVVALASESSGVKISSVVVGVTGDHISSINTRGSTTINQSTQEITEYDVARVLESARSAPITAGREIIHALPRGFTVDGQTGVRQPVGMCGSQLDVDTHIVTGASSFLQNVFKCVEQAGLQVRSVVLEPVASSKAVLSEAEMEVGALVVDIGGGTADIAVVVDGAIAHSAVIPVGGGHVTADLALGLKVSRGEAERLKREYGCAQRSLVSDNDLIDLRTIEGDGCRQITRDAIADIVEPRMHELFTLIRQEIRSHGFRNTLTIAVLCGGGSLLHGAPELAGEVLGLPVRIGRPRNLSSHAEQLDSPVFATAVGLLYFGAADHPRKRRDVDTRRFVRCAWEQLKNWLLHTFEGSR